MSAWLRWLTGIDLSADGATLAPGQAGVEFAFEHPIPSWGWALVVLGAAALAIAAYRRLEGARWARIALGSLRALLLIVLAVLLAGPRLVKPNESEEKDWVVVLVDRSSSLSVPDGASASTQGSVSPGSLAGEAESPARTREDQLRSAIAGSRSAWEAIDTERVLVWLGFDSGAYELPLASREGVREAVPTLGEPVGRRTDLSRALEQALRRTSARPLAGIVVLSDGRSVDEPSRSVLRALEAQKVPVFTLPLGSAAGLVDLSVRRVDAPRSAFVKDLVPVAVEVERSGPAISSGPAGSGEGSESAIVELVDQATGQVMDSRSVSWAAQASSPAGGLDARSQSVRRVTLTARPTISGAGKWLVRVKRSPGAGANDMPDMIPGNNTASLNLDLVDRPLRVAYFDGYPRWEYRFLKNLIVRERSMSSVIMLLAPGRRYLQEGTIVLDSLPRSPEDWNKFDVVVIGDVLPGVFTQEQLQQLRQRISIGGAGLLWIGGEGATPNAWRGTPLADLLPFSLSESASADNIARDSGPSSSAGGGSVVGLGSPMLIEPTLAAESAGVLRLSETEVAGAFWPKELSEAATGWSLLYWGQRIDVASLKPAAEVLANFRGAQSRETVTPALLSMRFGAGRSLYVATDEVWRWRYGQGERLPERFWLQLIRLLGRESLGRAGRTALLEASPERAEGVQPVRVSVTLLDQQLVEASPASIKVRVQRATPIGGAGETLDADRAPFELTLNPENASSGAGGGAGGGKPSGTRTFATTWLPQEPGKYALECVDPLLLPRGGVVDGAPAQPLRAGVEILETDDEMRQPQTDHALLARLSQVTGGRVLKASELNELPKLLPNRRLRVSGEPAVHTLWDSPLALLVIVLLLTLEWVGRRILHLS